MSHYISLIEDEKQHKLQFVLQSEVKLSISAPRVVQNLSYMYVLAYINVSHYDPVINDSICKLVSWKQKHGICENILTANSKEHHIK